jgi:hypothetical protein
MGRLQKMIGRKGDRGIGREKYFGIWIVECGIDH